MKLYKQSNWYNPYFVDVNDKSYEISKIHFFDREKGIICSTRSGWFGGGDNNLPKVDIDVDCIVKRKVDFSCKSAFVVNSGERNWDNTSKYELYIPSNVVGVKEPIVERRTMRYLVIKWETNIDGVYCDLWHWVDKDLSEIEKKISNVGEKINRLYGDNYNDLPIIIKTLEDLNKERIKEVERLNNINGDAILSQYKK